MYQLVQASFRLHRGLSVAAVERSDMYLKSPCIFRAIFICIVLHTAHESDRLLTSCTVSFVGSASSRPSDSEVGTLGAILVVTDPRGHSQTIEFVLLPVLDNAFARASFHQQRRDRKSVV